MRTTLKVKSERAANCSSTERFWKSSACVTVSPTLVLQVGRAGRRMRIEAGLGCCVRLGRRGHLKELLAVAWGGLDHASDQVGGRRHRGGGVEDLGHGAPTERGPLNDRDSLVPQPSRVTPPLPC